jgi:hypothetical protein
MTMLCHKDERAYDLELPTGYISGEEENTTYITYGVRLRLRNGTEIFHYRDISFHLEHLRQYLDLILRSDVPYYQVGDLMEDYLLA